MNFFKKRQVVGLLIVAILGIVGLTIWEFTENNTKDKVNIENKTNSISVESAKSGETVPELASRSSKMRNGIEQNPGEFVELNTVEITPHSFVENVWEALDRFASQEEWELWHNRLIKAKSQGASQLLAEIKTLERNVFSMNEYIARQRTNKEFVEDVFWSHLFRQPTQAEKKYWERYLNDLPSSIPQQKKRMRLINEFERLPDFEELVNNIVDSNDAPLQTTP